MASKRR